jgi:hypothetical protein
MKDGHELSYESATALVSVSRHPLTVTSRGGGEIEMEESALMTSATVR